jgi:hypothetical protein
MKTYVEVSIGKSMRKGAGPKVPVRMAALVVAGETADGRGDQRRYCAGIHRLVPADRTARRGTRPHPPACSVDDAHRAHERASPGDGRSMLG